MFKYSSAQSSFIPKFLVDFFFGNMSIKKENLKRVFNLNQVTVSRKKEKEAVDLYLTLLA